MWHLLAFYKADVAAAVNEAIPGVTDQIVNKSTNGNYMLQDNMRVRAGYFRDSGATGARLNTPDFRRLSIPNIHPVQRQAGVTDLPAVHWFSPGGITIPKIDEIIFEGSNDGAGGVAAVGGLWISPLSDNMNIPQGDSYKIHGTVTTAGVAVSWELKPIILDEILPAGNYAIIGMDAISRAAANVVEFARLAWTGGNMPGGGNLWRPGVLVPRLQSMQNWPRWQNGNWGTLGSFASTAPPQCEVFSVAGTTAVLDIYLDVVRLN